MSEEPVLCESKNGIAHLRLNRPSVLNAIDNKLCRGLIASIERIEGDSAVRVIVLSGNGARAFSSGADLKHMRLLAGADLRRFIELTWHAFDRLARSPLPSIAALHGHVLGGGLELALACDMRIAQSDAQLRLPEIQLGSVPGSGAVQRLPALVGRAKAAELIFMGEILSASDAERIGLVNKVVADGTALGTAIDWAQRIASRSREAVRYLKIGLSAETAQGIAPAFHGMISDLCHREPRYEENTARFGTQR